MSNIKFTKTNTIGERIKIIRMHFNLGIREFSNKSGISKSYTSELENNKRKPGSGILISLSRTFRVNPTWILTGEGDVFLESDHLLGDRDHITTKQSESLLSETINTKKIPVLGRVAAGWPNIKQEDVIDYIYIPGVEISNDAYALIVKGESMSPTLKDGDYVIFIRTDTVYNGDIVILQDIWDETCIKRYRKKDNQIIFTSDNSEYPTIIPINENYNIIGKVITVWRKIKI